MRNHKQAELLFGVSMGTLWACQKIHGHAWHPPRVCCQRCLHLCGMDLRLTTQRPLVMLPGMSAGA